MCAKLVAPTSFFLPLTRHHLLHVACVDELLTPEGKKDAMAAGRKIAIGYYITSFIVFLSLAIVITVLIWGAINLANTSKKDNDVRFFTNVVIGMAVSGGGHLMAVITGVYLGYKAMVMCTEKGERGFVQRLRPSVNAAYASGKKWTQLTGPLKRAGFVQRS